MKKILLLEYSTLVGATLACGTGACAVVVAAVLEGRAGRVSCSFKSTEEEKNLL